MKLFSRNGNELQINLPAPPAEEVNFAAKVDAPLQTEVFVEGHPESEVFAPLKEETFCSTQGLLDLRKGYQKLYPRSGRTRII
jgi:hypothetical protein